MADASKKVPDTFYPWKGRELHFIGIGGAGMSGLALVANQLGATVTGSDQSESTYTELLKREGIDFEIGHSAEQLPEQAEVVISSAVPDDNPELLKASELGRGVLHRGDLLAELTELKQCIAVSGTHGKTTTTAMIVHILDALNLDPAFLIGGEVTALGTNARWGSGWLVVEADESDRSFLKLSPDVALVTNVELDHHTTYGSHLELEQAFKQFLALLPERGAAVALAELVNLVPAGVEGDTFTVSGSEAATFSVEQIQYLGTGTHSKLLCSGKPVADLQLVVPGSHNILNALAAVAAVSRAGVDPARAATALVTFKGVDRRFQARGSFQGAELYDDYAHHPSEVKATLEAALAAEPRRLITVFQPHLYSRTLALHRAFGRALALADLVLVTDVYPAREEPVGRFKGVSGKLVAEATSDAGAKRVFWCPSLEDVRSALRSTLREGDLAITLGAGDIYKVLEQLSEA